MVYKTEACVINLTEALHAFHHGAHRLEVCSRIETEGMTPDVHLVKEIMDQTKLPVRVMIRETEAGYEADDEVLQKMISAVGSFKEIPVDGFVFGLMKSGRIDRGKMEVLLQYASPIPVTFHKAIDASVDVMDDLQWMHQQSLIDTILTSGQMSTAEEGAENILSMKTISGKRIMPGGRITNDNVEALHEKLGLEWYHGRQIV